MASYPGAVKTFTTRNAGDVVQGSHVNDLQDEVNAIEAGLLNGTAPLNSSNSTVVRLNVTNGMDVGANSTIHGNLTLTGTLVGGNTFTAGVCKLTNSASQSLNVSGDWVGLSWDTETTDASGMHSTASNSSRITFAASSGFYLVSASIVWANPSSGSFHLRIMLNDVTNQAASAVSTLVGAGGQIVTAGVYATSTSDYVTVQALQLTGSTNTITNSTSGATAFWAARVG